MRLLSTLAAVALLLLCAPVAAHAASEQTVKIQAKNFEFMPHTITLRLHQKYRLEFVATEGMHGIAIPDLGVNSVVTVQSTPSYIEVTPSKVGTYVAHCQVFCGAGHVNMALTIKVVQ
ncbi:MAG TPA: cupredoxin domain-containing protein [Candidatus Aquilonibacter sp.]